MSFFSRIWNSLRYGHYADAVTPPSPAAAAPLATPAAPASSSVAAPPAAVAPGVSFPNRAAFDAWLPTTPLHVGLDYVWMNQYGIGGIGYYTQPDGSISTEPPKPAFAPYVPPAANTPTDPPASVPIEPPAKPQQPAPPPEATLAPLQGDALRDVLFLCAVGTGGPLTPAYQRASAALGSALNSYINAYRGQRGDGSLFNPREHTGMLLYAWDPARTPPSYVRAIGGMSPEAFDSIKGELVPLGISV